jgi:hypothetical protein
MKYTTKPRKKVAYTFKAKKWFKLNYKPKNYNDIKNYTYILGMCRSAVYNDIGMSINGGKKPRQYATI